MSLEINTGYTINPKYITPQKLKNNRAVPQTFTSHRTKDKTNNGQFDIDVALNNFGKGLFSPITAIIKHPIAKLE